MSATPDLERLFKAGISAYQEGEYQRAIASLARLSNCESSAYRAKASMGLVRVYMAQKNWTKAQSLCEKVGTSANPALRDWSQKTLAKISRRSAADAGKAASSTSTVPPARKRRSGFQLLEPADASASEEKIVDAIAADQPPIAQLATPPAQTAPSLPAPLHSSGFIAADDDAGKPYVSMFHYAYLNGDEDIEAPVDSESPLVTQASSQVAASCDGVAQSPADETLGWIYAGRLSRGKKLGRIKRGQLRIAQIGGAIAFFYLWRTLIRQFVAVTNGYLTFLDRRLPVRFPLFPDSWREVTWPLLGFFCLFAIASPWLWDVFLRCTASGQPFSVSALRAQSAESAKVINDACRQRRWRFPTLWKLPTDIPLIFSYGWLPRNARIVISQGLLAQLEADEIAALVAYEMAHWKSWNWPLLSAQGLILQGLLWLYWQLALWSNQRKTVVKYAAGTAANAIYSVFWLSRLPVLGMARVRTYFGDRAAAVTTGNPNGLTRALTKLSFGLAASVAHKGYTPISIEGLTPLLPVSADLARQRLFQHLPLSQLFAWDSQNVLRGWLSCMDPHPPLGDRTRLLMAYAQHWQLVTEIQLPPASKSSSRSSSQHSRRLSVKQWQRLSQQSTPYLGLAIGFAVGTMLLTIGALAAALNSPPETTTEMAVSLSTSKPPSLIWSALEWMHQDIGLFQCCLLLGASVGTILRINRFFPDLSFSFPLAEDFSIWVTDSSLLPADSPAIKLSGRLIGRPGAANWLGQDWLLKTNLGLLKLHYFSALGPLGNLLTRSATPDSVRGQSVQILGWFRRGNHPWLDVDKIRAENGQFLQAAHPIYSLLFAAIAGVSGLWLLIRSGG